MNKKADTAATRKLDAATKARHHVMRKAAEELRALESKMVAADVPPHEREALFRKWVRLSVVTAFGKVTPAAERIAAEQLVAKLRARLRRDSESRNAASTEK